METRPLQTAGREVAAAAHPVDAQIEVEVEATVAAIPLSLPERKPWRGERRENATSRERWITGPSGELVCPLQTAIIAPLLTGEIQRPRAGPSLTAGTRATNRS